MPVQAHTFPPFFTPDEQWAIDTAPRFAALSEQIDRLAFQRDLWCTAFDLVSKDNTELRRELAELKEQR